MPDDLKPQRALAQEAAAFRDPDAGMLFIRFLVQNLCGELVGWRGTKMVQTKDQGRPILVTGATGLQGGSVAAKLIASGVPVRALVRDPQSPASVRLSQRGAEVVKGDFEDRDSLLAAMSGVKGVFSVQLPPTNPNDPESEVRTGKALVSAAISSGVETYVHTSVARAGDQRNFAGWDQGRWWNLYWDSKSAVNDAVQAAGFPSVTILKPAYMMDNFTAYADLLFPALKHGLLETALEPDTRLDLIAAEDMGSFAAAAFIEPHRFNGLAIDLAAESLTMMEIAKTIESVKGVPIRSVHLTVPEALAAGMLPAMAQSYEWDNVEGYKVDIPALAALGIPLTSFKEWTRQNRDEIRLA